MLSRTADHLFWMARYMERAENTARMLDVNYQTLLMPRAVASAEQLWRGLLSISELAGDYADRYGAIASRKVMDYMVRDEHNPSSIYPACARRARTHAQCGGAHHRGVGNPEPDLAGVQAAHRRRQLPARPE